MASKYKIFYIVKGVLILMVFGGAIIMGLNYYIERNGSSFYLPFMASQEALHYNEYVDNHLYKTDFWVDCYVPFEINNNYHVIRQILGHIHSDKIGRNGRIFQFFSPISSRIKKSISEITLNTSLAIIPKSNDFPIESTKLLYPSLYMVENMKNANKNLTKVSLKTSSNIVISSMNHTINYNGTLDKYDENKFDNDSLESTVTLLRKKLHSLQRRTSLDPNLLNALNQTLSNPSSENTILSLLIEVVKQLEESDHQADKEIYYNKNSLSRVVVPKVDAKVFQPVDLCENIRDFRIFPNDSKTVVLKKQASLMRCYMNITIDPCQDFYEYACGNWHKHHTIPRDRGSWDIFEILREDLDVKLVNILNNPIQPSDNNSTRAIKTLYSSCMNTDQIEKLRHYPLLQLLKNLGGWPVLDENWNSDKFDWIETIAKLRLFNNDILVAVWIGPDGEKSENNIVQFDQSDLHLPSFEYYKLGIIHPIIQTYYKFLVDVATLLGANKSRAMEEMMNLIHFEMELANIMIPPHQRRNFSQMYQKMTLGELSISVPKFNFSAYLKDLFPRKLQSSEHVVMYSLPYLKKLTTIIEKTNKRTIGNYILWRFIRHRINNLDSRFQRVQKDIYLKLSGRVETPPRWKYCVAYVNGNLGYSVGASFVKKYFDRQSKKDMELLTNEVQTIFRKLVRTREWLTNTTKKLADEKIKEIFHNIGYPDFILNDDQLQEEVDGLNYNKDGFFDNVLSNLRSRTMKEMQNFEQKVDRTVWTITPAVVNAFYSRNKNQIMFPAGILQPPFYHKYFPKSINFGGIGVVIGHEITHGFDDKGRQFDQFGNIRRWWDHSSSEKFESKAKCFVDQYSNYLVKEVGTYLNGWNTQGENIADNGGLKESYMIIRGYKYEISF
ncbi:neprilysin-4 isoform X4 [Lepeophtheirus salmonis]|uniref:neprilysin-4 isoform X4 n=1 Tax=Lepeophtheirus salmonis TaxID=72036 RepID=UPI001AE63C99|nr:neprilysin-4-like isoform X5 [Lepeophtheirus salmonis]